MQAINEITPENFNKSFDLRDILNDSTFYPAAGIDACDIECLSDKCNSFVHVDYSMPRELVEPAMRNHFEGVGYNLIGLRHISKNELTPEGFSPRNFQMNNHERERLQKPSIRDRFYCQNFTPFALWAVYELDPAETKKTNGKIQKFSLLHIGGEACTTFEAIYLNHKVNPYCVAIISPGEGYGDNWTVFTDPNFRLHQSLKLNYEENGTPMPGFLLTDTSRDVMWHNYIKAQLQTCKLTLFERSV